MPLKRSWRLGFVALAVGCNASVRDEYDPIIFEAHHDWPTIEAPLEGSALLHSFAAQVQATFSLFDRTSSLEIASLEGSPSEVAGCAGFSFDYVEANLKPVLLTICRDPATHDGSVDGYSILTARQPTSLRVQRSHSTGGSWIGTIQLQTDLESVLFLSGASRGMVEADIELCGSKKSFVVRQERGEPRFLSYTISSTGTRGQLAGTEGGLYLAIDVWSTPAGGFGRAKVRSPDPERGFVDWEACWGPDLVEIYSDGSPAGFLVPPPAHGTIDRCPFVP